ncbi:MAG TPA: lamin tail domain-containing protein [Rhodanobacteraceae bacterium]|nr:lamin tail domain-containing protein [Rhodanobacteraceae bacterium]
MRSNQLRHTLLMATTLSMGVAGAAHATGVVISQVYGGGGNSGAPLHNDFIELFNAGPNAQSLAGWSVQYASSGGSTWNNATPLPDVTLAPGEYLLIQEAAGTGGGAALPTPDVTGAINMSGTAGKVALVDTTTSLAGTCPTDASIVDFIGYGNAASCAEGTHTGDLSNTTAALRNDGGCMDTNDNSADFALGAPAPRNSASPQNPCGGIGIALAIGDVGVDEGDAGTTDAVFTVTLSEPIDSDVTFDIATADGTATAGSDYAATSVTGATIPAGATTYTFTVAIDGDTDPEPDETFEVNVSNVSGAGVTTTAAQATGTIVNDDAVHIYDIQGNGAHSAFLDSVTTTSGQVTAVGDGGFFMQDAAGDGDANTSDAIFVFTNDQNPAGLAPGSVATVTGRVTEFFGLTEFTNSPPLAITVQKGKPTIQPIVLNHARPSSDPAAPYCSGSFGAGDSIAVQNWRCLQSMLVRLDDGVVSAPNFFANSQPLSEFYAYVAGQPRPYRGEGLPFGTVVDNPPAGYDPPIWDGVPYVFGVDTGKLLAPQAMNGGMHFTATGIMGFDFGIGILWPTSFAITDNGPPYPQPVQPSPAGSLTIGSQNMLRFFDAAANSPGIDDCENTNPGSSDVCPTPAEFAIRLAKMSLQVRQVLRAPAVLAVEEMENLPALQSLADRIHADDANLTYTPYLVEGNDIGGIDVGFLVRGDVGVNAVTQLGKSTQTIDGCGTNPPCLLNDRPPLLLDASLNGHRFAVLAVHNRSLSGIDDPEDGHRIRRKRLEQAEYVAAIAQSWQTNGAFALPDGDVVPNPDASVPLVIVGDYNAFQYTDGYVDVVGEIKGTAVESENTDWSAPVTVPKLVEDCGVKAAATPQLPYSFSFDGYVQELDHALFTNVAAAACMTVRRAHGNADVAEGGSATTDPTTAARSADHDGFVATLKLRN